MATFRSDFLDTDKAEGVHAQHHNALGDMLTKLTTRTVSSYVVTGLAVGATATGAVRLAAGYRLLSLSTSAPVRVRLYTSAAKRTADAARDIGTDPGPQSGVLLDYVTTDNSTQEINPVVVGWTSDGSSDVAIAVTNTGATAATAITATFVYLANE